jgi:hypothetical protein
MTVQPSDRQVLDPSRALALLRQLYLHAAELAAVDQGRAELSDQVVARLIAIPASTTLARYASWLRSGTSRFNSLRKLVS